MLKPAVLIDERDRRIGKLMVHETCFVIRHKTAIFIRTPKAVRLHHSHRSMAIVFEETEVYVRDKLEAI